jgi:ketopantoate reductase
VTDDHRSETTLTGTEREQLAAFLHDNRLEVVGLLDGLTEEQARRRLVPSQTTLLGIVKHAVFVEKAWFHVSLVGRTRAEVGIPEAAEDSWLLDEEDTIESVVAAYRQAWAEADEIAAAHALDDLAVHNRRGPLTLRWIWIHLVEELARHSGHGDILREQVLAGSEG